MEPRATLQSPLGSRGRRRPRPARSAASLLAIALTACAPVDEAGTSTGGGGAVEAGGGGAGGGAGGAAPRPDDPFACLDLATEADCRAARCTWHAATLFPTNVCSEGIETFTCTWFEEWGITMPSLWSRPTPAGLWVVTAYQGPNNPEGVVGFSQCADRIQTVEDPCECLP